VTDANLVLGRFGGATLLGGDFALDESRAEEALARLAREMTAAGGRKVSAVEAALGVVRVVGVGMERALRVVSVERGHDPRAFALVTFGGAGGLHAVELARALRVPRVIVPRRPGALSAHGALQSDVVKDLSRTVMLDASDARTASAIEREFRRLDAEARAALRREGFGEERQRLARSVAARYRGQSFELEVEWTGATRALVERFERAHEARYGYRRGAGAEVELVSARVRAVGLVEKLPRERARRCLEDKTEARPAGRTRVYFEEGRREVSVYAREQLGAGARLKAPCIVTEYSSTTLVPAGARAQVDAHGNLIIEP
jgi:N-methylhydantoinase A